VPHRLGDASPDPEFAFFKLKATMKRFLSFLTVALLGPIWRMPAWAGAGLTTVGIGGILTVVAILTPPSIAPQPSAAFSNSNSYGYLIQGLQTNNGSTGAFELPSTCSANSSFPQTCSFAVYNEFTVDQLSNEEWVWGASNATNGEFLSGAGNGLRTIYVQATAAGNSTSNYDWWMPTVGSQPRSTNPITLGTLTTYAEGVFSATAVDGCPTSNGTGAREPTIAFTHGEAALAFTIDPGFLCGMNASGQPPQIPMSAIAGFGQQQTGLALTCAPNTPISGKQFTVTVTAGYAHGLNPGQSFTLSSATNTAFDETYVAVAGTSGATLVGAYANGTGTCPASSDTVTLNGGTGGSISIAAPAENTVFATQNGTGITVRPGQRVCGLVGEFGADSAFPGAQFAKYTDIQGNDLPGSPAVSPWLNMGAANFTGYTRLGPQTTSITVTSLSGGTMTTSASVTIPTGATLVSSAIAFAGATVTVGGTGTSFTISNTSLSYSGSAATTALLPALIVTAMNPYSLVSPYASYNSTTGYATFTFAANPGITIGSEFTVSDVSPSGYNQTYVAVAGTSGTTVVGNPLSGPIGLPQANNPGASAGSGGSAVTVIMPGMYIPGTNGAASLIAPFGTYGSTGVGGVGTYALTQNQSALSVTASGTSTTPPYEITISGLNAVSPQISFGDAVGGTGVTAGTIITGFVSGTLGSDGVYDTNIAPPSGTIASATVGPLWSSASPGPIYAAAGYYYTLTPSASAPYGSVTIHPSTSFADFANLIGSSSTATASGLVNNARAWGGAIANIGMFEGAPFPNSGGVPSASAMTGLCTKTTDFQSFASANGGAWRTLYRLSDPGVWGDSGNAQITGYITNSTGTNATLNVSSTINGSLALSTGTETAYLSGQGLLPSSAPTIPLTSSASSTYAITPNTTAALGSSGSPVTLNVGAYKPATPVAQSQITASISGNTLTVSAADINSTFSASYANSSTNGGGTLTTTATPSGLLAGMCVWDGGVYIQPNNPLCVTAGSGTSWTTNGGTTGFNYLPTLFPPSGTETMYATETAIRPGDFVQGAGITTPVQVTGYGSLAPCATTGFPMCGTYTISNPGGLSVSSEAMTLSGVQAGGAIAPGAALTVQNPGIGATYPVTNWGAMTGTLPFNGEFSNSLLGGNPSAIQAQVSATPGGPALSGCSACVWTNLSSATVNTGAETWAGSIVGIPSGGPYWVSFRAANGQAYATLPNAVFVGANVAGFGEGNAVDQVLSSTSSSINQTYFQGYSTMAGFPGGGIPGNWNSAGIYIPGPSLLNGWAPSRAGQLLVDRFGVIPNGAMNDGAAMQIGNTSALLGGAPVGFLNMYKNGTGFQNEFYGGVPQTQTIGLGNGSTTTFSSGAGFGGSVSTGAPSIQITGGVTTAGTMTVAVNNSLSATVFPWGFINIGQYVSCTTCMAGGAYSGIITAFGTGTGSSGTYVVSPPPGTAIASTTRNLTVTPNNLEFNGAWGYGASIAGAVSSGVLTVNAVNNGVMAPLMTVSDGTNNDTLTTCLTNCNLMGAYQATSTWQLAGGSGSPLNGDTSAANFTVEPHGGPLWPSLVVQPTAIPVQVADGVAGGGNPVIQVGTFQVLVNGTVYCSDNSTFSYNQQVGNCVDSGSVNRGWVNYTTGGYSITFASAPATNAAIVAKWTNIMTTDSSGANEQIDWTGGASATSGVLASVAVQSGGVNAYLDGQQNGAGGWPDYQTGYAKEMNYFFATKLAGLHGGLANQPRLEAGQWRGLGTQAMLGYFSFGGNLDGEQFAQDTARLSNFSGTISSAGGSSAAYTAKLTLTAAATGTMWEGEALECNPFNLSCVLPGGTEIVGLDPSSTSGWGASGSVYDLTTDSTTTSFAAAASAGTLAIHNAMYYPPGNAAYVGPYNDLAMQCGYGGGYCVETGAGITGALRYGNRAGVEIGAALSGNPSKGTDPTLDRTSFTGCDSAATTLGVSPCFDVGSTFAASHSATWSGSTFTITGGLSAGQRPFVPGMALSCSGCNSGLVALSISLPPTQSSATGAGQISQTFTITASGAIGGSGSGTVTGGCSGTSGTGSNCIDFKIDINTTGPYGTTAALNTCGTNNLMGTNASANTPTTTTYVYANGQCVPTGVGDLIHGFRIGSVQVMDQQAASGNLGSAYDFGMDPGQYSSTGPSGVIAQNEAFTCNIVSAVVVECVHGPTYVNGAFSSIGQWLSGATFAQFGDVNNAFSFMTGLVGYPGGQSFPFTAGSGYTTPSGVTNYVTGGICALNSGGTEFAPAMGFNVSGGAIVNAYPTQIGSSIFGTCTFPISFTFTGVISGYSSANHTANLAVTGIGTTPTASNPGSIVPGEILTGPSFTGYAVVVSGPLNGVNGTYVINTTNSNITTSLASETMTSGPTNGSGGAITTPSLVNIDGIGGFDYINTDNNMSNLMDNSGVSGNPLAGKFLTPAGNLESTGLPVRPFGMRRGVQVSG
jgi:hypothetical protein